MQRLVKVRVDDESSPRQRDKSPILEIFKDPVRKLSKQVERVQRKLSPSSKKSLPVDENDHALLDQAKGIKPT